MAINLKLIPAPATRPAPPKWWVWLLLLIVALFGGIAYAVLINQTKTEINNQDFWETALAIPASFWLFLLFLRLVWYQGVSAMANDWDRDREKMIEHETQRGRRSLQILGLSLNSALRELDDTDGQTQWDALQARTQALKTQASWQSDKGIRHSRLARRADEALEPLLTREFTNLLDELSRLLLSVPVDVPLALLIENHSRLPNEQVQALWQSSWQASQIKHRVIPVEGSGLAAVDQWLDQRAHEQSLLLVVAMQIEPESPEGTAEAVIGLLLGNPHLQTELAPMASLHRPEQAHGIAPEDVNYALVQSLDWGPVSADEVTAGYMIGVDATWHTAIAMGLEGSSSPMKIGQDLQDLGSSLGYPGPAAPWLAVACAAVECAGGKPQLIVSGDNQANTPLWATLVTPVTQS